MKNKEIAQKIVDGKAQIEKVKHSENDEKNGTAYVCRLINVAGFNLAFEAKTKKQASQQTVDYIEAELDAGNVVLADVWVEENLGA